MSFRNSLPEFREALDLAIAADAQSRDFESSLREVLATDAQQFDQSAFKQILEFIRNYPRLALDLVDSIDKGARKSKVVSRINPLLDAATSHWNEYSVSSNRIDYASLIKSSYITLSLLQEASKKSFEADGQPLFDVELEGSNRLAFQLLSDISKQEAENRQQTLIASQAVKDSLALMNVWSKTLEISSPKLANDLRLTEKLDPELANELEGKINIALVRIATDTRQDTSDRRESNLTDYGAAGGGLRSNSRAEPKMRRRASEIRKGFEYEVWYGTTREPLDQENHAAGFSNDIDPRGVTHYGKCTVLIPQTHKFGSIGEKWYRRWRRGEFQSDSIEITAYLPVSDREKFFSDFSAYINTLAKDERAVMVFIHGYNVSFEEAAIRAAQMGFDLGVPGATAFFSWPSTATIEGYPADADRIAASEKEMADFLVDIADQSCAETVNLIAHSMGCRGLTRAIQRVSYMAGQSSHKKFNQIVLAAPDIEVKLFQDLANLYPSFSNRTTMYVSDKDKALGLSKWLQQSNRAGYAPPVTVVDRIDTVKVDKIDLTILGHGYYAEAEPVLYDMDDLLRHNSDPSKRVRLEQQATTGQPCYWAIKS